MDDRSNGELQAALNVITLCTCVHTSDGARHREADRAPRRQQRHLHGTEALGHAGLEVSPPVCPFCRRAC